MSEPTQAPPLWSDEAIDKRLDGWFGERYKDEDREAYIRSGRDLITQYMIWMRDDYEELRQQDAALLAAKDARIAELEALIAYIDAHAPRADSTCDEPGITFSQACRRAMKDESK